MVLNTKLIARLEMQYENHSQKHVASEVIKRHRFRQQPSGKCGLERQRCFMIGNLPSLPDCFIVKPMNRWLMSIASLQKPRWNKMAPFQWLLLMSIPIGATLRVFLCHYIYLIFLPWFFNRFQQLSSWLKHVEHLPNPASSMVYVKGNTAVGVSLLDAKGTGIYARL